MRFKRTLICSFIVSLKYFPVFVYQIKSTFVWTAQTVTVAWNPSLVLIIYIWNVKLGKLRKWKIHQEGKDRNIQCLNYWNLSSALFVKGLVKADKDAPGSKWVAFINMMKANDKKGFWIYVNKYTCRNMLAKRRKLFKTHIEKSNICFENHIRIDHIFSDCLTETPKS